MPRLLAAFAVLVLLPRACIGDTANIIFDTDMSGDVDDAGALGILNKFTNLGEARMLACITNNGVKGKAVGGCIRAINSYYGNGDVPIGTYHGTKYAEMFNVYDAQIRDEFVKDEPPDDQLPPALQVYRRTLNGAPDGSVTIVSVGFFVNLEELLKSSADGDSPLPGLDLVKKKVRKLVVMGGLLSVRSGVEFQRRWRWARHRLRGRELADADPLQRRRDWRWASRPESGLSLRR